MNNTQKTKSQLVAELKIRDALDRVRDRALAMQTSEEISDVASVLFDAFHTLGFQQIRSGIVIIHEADEELEAWFVRGKDDIAPRGRMALDEGFETPQAKAGYEAWKQSARHYIITFTGEEAENVMHSVVANTHADVDLPDGEDWPDQVFVHWLFFSDGYLFLTCLEKLSEEYINTAGRFARVFGFAYDRYLQLKEKEAQNRALQEANARLEEATRLKSQFLATMSHELRTPMNAIIGFTRLVLRRADNLADRQRENLEKVKLSADHLLNLINEILDLSKIEAGRIDIQPATFDLKMLIANCCATVGPTLGKPSVTLRYDVADDAVEVFSDEARLRQIVINLLSNALKFTDEGEVAIWVSIQELGERGQGAVNGENQRHVLEIAVQDTGIGIPEAQLEAVFEEFRQVDGSSTRKIQGTGLGLAITKKLVELLGGTISVTSVLGEGSTFTFCIPARYGEAVDTSSDMTASAAPVIDANNRLIVSIDDDPNVAVLLRQELEDDGYQVISALNADEGIALVKKHKPVAVTVDILMPGKDGWQTIAALKADAETRDVPVIVVSAIENKELGFSLGIHDYIVKPFDHDALMGSLKRLNPQGMRDILVVEDEPSAADLLCQMLEGDGLTPRTAYNGRKALACIKEKKPDAIFLDLMMPEMDGFEVIEQLQLREDWKRIPVIVVTAKDLTLEESAYLHARVNQVIQKGNLDSDVLENTLQDILDRYLDNK